MLKVVSCICLLNNSCMTFRIRKWLDKQFQGPAAWVIYLEICELVHAAAGEFGEGFVGVRSVYKPFEPNWTTEKPI